MRAIYEDAERLSIKLENVRNEAYKSPADFSVLLASKPVYYDDFQRALYDYSNALTVYRYFVSDSNEEHRGSLAKVVDSERRHLLRAKYGLEKWIDGCIEEMRTARRLLK